jgi:hypothetical protein
MAEKNAKAFQILGLRGGSSQLRASTLEDELNLYYATYAEKGIDVIAFWEVGVYYLSILFKYLS